MQTNIELASASGRPIGLPLAGRRERQSVVSQRRRRPAPLFRLVTEVKRAERWETMVWVGIAIAAVVLLVMSFAIKWSPAANEQKPLTLGPSPHRMGRGEQSKAQRHNALAFRSVDST